MYLLEVIPRLIFLTHFKPKRMKKNQIFSMMLAAAVAFGAASCDKTTEGAGDVSTGGTGDLAISFAFGEQESTRATQSTAKPITTWKNNIKSAAVFCANTAGVVKYAQSVTLDLTKTDGAAQQVLLPGIPAGTYNVYVFTNWDQGDVTNQSMKVSTAKGRNIQDLYMEALSAASDAEDYVTDAEKTTSKFYKEAPEVFVAKQDNITVRADQSVTVPTAFKLERIVGLVRVRIYPKDPEAVAHIDFKNAKSSVRLRRIFTGSNLNKNLHRIEEGTIAAEKTTFLSIGAFKDQEPTEGYDMSGGKKILTDSNFKFWKDMILFPGGADASGASASKLNLVITGITKDNQYVPAGKTEPAGQGSQIAWVGGVNGKLNPNGILELNCTISSAGTVVIDPSKPGGGDGEVPEAGEYGNLTISVELVPWGNITSVDVEM